MIDMIESYLKENIDDDATVKIWNKKNGLPIYLRNSYDIFELTVLETQCILIEMIEVIPSTDQLKKHMMQINKITNNPVVLLFKEITSYRRKMLIQNRIPFVVRDKQMYLPFLGLDLKRKSEPIENIAKSFTTPGQMAYLYFLYNQEKVVNTTGFAQAMGFNMMTASRALNELYRLNLITFKLGGKTSKSKEYTRIGDPIYFLRGQKYLKSPIRKIVHTKIKPSGALVAGQDALAILSMLNPPDHPIMAISRDLAKEIQTETLNDLSMIRDLQPVELELWDYDPKLFGTNDTVDVLSLYASLKNETDDRVVQALDEILEAETWYRG